VSLVLFLLALILLLLTVLPLSIHRAWWVRALDFPRLQIAALALIWLLLWLIIPHQGQPWLMLAVLAVLGVLVYQCYWIFPNTELHRQEVARYDRLIDGAHPTLKLLNSNVLMTNRDSEPLLALIRQHQPDIVITLESDQWWQDQLDSLEGYPHRIACPLDNLYGMHVYSALPLHNACINYLVENDKPSMSATVQVRDHVPVRLHVVHPAPPAPGENDESTERDVELLLLARSLAGSEERIIVAGDLNDVAWSATTRLFRQISGLLDLRIGRGLYNTFSADHWYARWPLDHFFVSSHFKAIDIQRLAHIGSDHFPLLVELAVTDDAQPRNAVQDEDVDEERLHSIMRSSAAQTAQMPVA
jgi:endonuclease/exonuclease/phosphatase (EEP) superfamily protein YafD